MTSIRSTALKVCKFAAETSQHSLAVSSAQAMGIKLKQVLKVVDRNQEHKWTIQFHHNLNQLNQIKSYIYCYPPLSLEVEIMLLEFL